MSNVYPFAATMEAAVTFVAHLEALVRSNGALAVLEDAVNEEGRRVLNTALQDAVDLGAKLESQPEAVTGADEVLRRHRRPVAVAHKTLFGRIVVRGCAWSARGASRLIPRTARLRLSPGMYSSSLRQHLCRKVVDSYFDIAVEDVERETGSSVPKRQAEEVVREAAVDFDAFYAAKAGVAPNDGHLLVLSMDGKGVVMTPSGLRAATRSRAEARRNKLKRRLSPRSRNGQAVIPANAAGNPANLRCTPRSRT